MAYPRSRSSSPSRSRKASSSSLVSCRQTTSGRRSSSQGSSRGTRCLTELTFQVASRTEPTVPAPPMAAAATVRTSDCVTTAAIQVRWGYTSTRWSRRGFGASISARKAHPRFDNPNGEDMQITKNSMETAAGPTEWFTGTVYIDTVAAPSNGSRLSASSVHFTPGARTAWHTHPNGQTIYVLEGVGRAQHRGGPLEVIRPGDRVFFGPGEEHWHGAAPDRFMTHIAMLDVDDAGNAATWGEHVTDADYAAAPSIEEA